MNWAELKDSVEGQGVEDGDDILRVDIDNVVNASDILVERNPSNQVEITTAIHTPQE